MCVAILFEKYIYINSTSKWLPLEKFNDIRVLFCKTIFNKSTVDLWRHFQQYFSYIVPYLYDIVFAYTLYLLF
jgi:hypothetical protein